MVGSASTTIDIPYVCAGGQNDEMQVQNNGKSLHCTGYIVDAIDRLTDTSIDDYERPEKKVESEKLDTKSNPDLYTFLSQCTLDLAEFLAAKSAYPPETHEEVLWRTVIWNRGRSGQKKADMQYEDLYKSFKDYAEFQSMSPQGIVEQSRPRIMGLDQEIGFLVPGDVASKILFQESDELRDQAEKFSNWAITICARMRRCGTTKGYVGHVPQSARIGDVVCVITGVAVPFTLRKTPEGYRVVGQCYLHGIMEGEALHDPGLQKEGIVLI
jgi:hypothetical protein